MAEVSSEEYGVRTTCWKAGKLGGWKARKEVRRERREKLEKREKEGRGGKTAFQRY